MIIPDKQWETCHPDILSNMFARSPDLYTQVIDQFQVETAKRYAKTSVLVNGVTKTTTWCNIFVRDVLKAMGVELPAKWAVGPGEPEREMTANLMALWLRGHGAENGWTVHTLLDAIKRANMGRPTFALWHNKEGHGHVAMLRPSGSEARIAQAGSHNFANAPIQNGFGGGKALEYWSHV